MATHLRILGWEESVRNDGLKFERFNMVQHGPRWFNILFSRFLSIGLGRKSWSLGYVRVPEGCPGQVREEMCSRLVKTMQQVSSEMADAEATLVAGEHWNCDWLGYFGYFEFLCGTALFWWVETIQQRIWPVHLLRLQHCVQSEVTTKQSCYLPFTRDSVPCMGKAPKHDNVYVATGHGCWGLRLHLHFDDFPHWNRHELPFRLLQLQDLTARLGHPSQFGKRKGNLVKHLHTPAACGRTRHLWSQWLVTGEPRPYRSWLLMEKPRQSV